MSLGPWKKPICRCGTCLTCKNREKAARHRNKYLDDGTGERMPWPMDYFTEPRGPRMASSLYGIEEEPPRLVLRSNQV